MTAKIIPIRRDNLYDVLVRAEKIAQASREAKSLSAQMKQRAQAIVEAVNEALREN